MTIAKEELRERLAALAHGPWSAGMAQARRELAPHDKLAVAVTRARSIALDQIQLTASNEQKSLLLATVLRPHFQDIHGITDQSEIQTRDALDQALILPELYELAVQTGYLPPESVRTPGRKILTDLLWSAAARGFVAAYDYIAVPMLAARVGVSGFGAAHPPEPNPKAELRFAGFLAHLRAFYGDTQIEVWTRFLDDYIVEWNEQNLVLRYLRGQSETAPQRTAELLAGCQRFVTSLASAFHILDDDELARFALIHGYWLQKFFGYKMDVGGYVKDTARWDHDDSWAQTTATSPHLMDAADNDKLATVARQQFRENVQLLERAFAAVRELAKSARRASTPSP
jgi:hypothetical protein